MKNIFILVSLVVFSTYYTCDCSAQALATNFTPQSTNNSKHPAVSNSKKLAAIVIQSNENRFSIGLHVESYVEGKISVKLRSSTTVLHKEVVESKTYVRKYDMYNLPVGEYQIKVENNEEAYTKKMTIQIINGVRVLSLL